MTPQASYELLTIVLRSKTVMTLAEHEQAQAALKTLGETINSLMTKLNESNPPDQAAESGVAE